MPLVTSVLQNASSNIYLEATNIVKEVSFSLCKMSARYPMLSLSNSFAFACFVNNDIPVETVVLIIFSLTLCYRFVTTHIVQYAK